MTFNYASFIGGRKTNKFISVQFNLLISGKEFQVKVFKIIWLCGSGVRIEDKIGLLTLLAFVIIVVLGGVR